VKFTRQHQALSALLILVMAYINAILIRFAHSPFEADTSRQKEEYAKDICYCHADLRGRAHRSALCAGQSFQQAHLLAQ
jgi:hypothetical protein